MTSFFTGEAQVHYGAADFTIMNPGAYVICAVTGEKVPIEHLRYWSHERQEPYKDAAASLEGFKRATA